MESGCHRLLSLLIYRRATLDPDDSSLNLTPMSTEAHSLSTPSDEQAYMYVSALEAGHLSVPLSLMAVDQSDDPITFPSLAFLLRHSESNKRVVFDLGIHRNIKEFAPAAIPVEFPLHQLT
jgi:hypothetical protein